MQSQKYQHPQQYWIKDKLLNLSDIDRLSFSQAIEQLTNSNKSHDSRVVIEEILSDYHKVLNVLRPLNDYGIFFDLWLSGEAVSDILLGHHKSIKNLTFLIKFRPFMDLFVEQYGFNKYFHDFKDDILAGHSINKDFIFNNWAIPFNNEIFHDSKIKLKLIKKINVELINLIFSANKIENKADFILEDDLIGSVVLGDGLLKFNTVIKVLNVDPDDFVKTFNFDLHKASVELVNSNLSIEGHDYQMNSVDDFFKRVKFEVGFLKDVVNKTVSINITDLSLKQIVYLCEKQYVLMMDKYNPKSWSVRFSNVDIENDQHEDFMMNEEKKESAIYVRHFLKKHELELKVEEKEFQEEKIRKI